MVGVASDGGDGPSRGLVDDLAAIVWEAGESGFTFVSRYTETLLGYPLARWFTEPGFFDSLVHPEDRDRVARVRRAAGGPDSADSGNGAVGAVEAIYRVTAADGRTVWLRDQVRVAGEALRGVAVDITAQRAVEERHGFLAELERQLQRRDDAEDIMALATRLVGEHVGADRCAYARAEDDENHFVMSGDHATGLPPLPGRFAMSAFGDGALSAMRAGEPWVVHDCLNDPRLTEYEVSTYRATGIRAVICLPLLRGGRFVAAMAVHQATVRQWSAEDVDLVSVAVNRCWESLQRAHADGALRDSEQRHRLLVERATDAIWVLDHDLRFVEANPAACALLGLDRAELIGTSVLDRFADGQAHYLSWVPGAEAAQPATDVWQLARADGSVVSVEVSVQATPTGVQAIGRDVTERLRAEAERELLARREHEIAETLQRALLPRGLPDLPHLAFAARYLPAASHAQIGGDWYEVIQVADTVVALTVGDVVGKGPTAAAVMGQLRSALAGYLLDGHSPAAALDRLDAFARRTANAAGSTCACLTFDWADGRLCWALAGHPPPLLLDAGGTRFLSGDADGPVLGLPGRPPFRESSTRLPVGASVLLYTDGLVERGQVPIDRGLDHLRQAVEHAHAMAPDPLADEITTALLQEGQSDDIALVVARHLPAPLVRTVPALPTELAGMRHEVAEWARAAAVATAALDDLNLALGEAAANAVDHAYPGRTGDFTYRVTATAGGMHAQVRDHGRWRPPPVDPGHRGRGLRIIHAVARNTTIDHDEDGTTVDFDIATAETPSAAPAAPEPVRPAAMAEVPGGGRQVLRVTGDLDLDTADVLRPALLAAVTAADSRPVELDLTGVGYLSSSGIALLLATTAAAAEAGRELAVVVTEHDAPARILEMSGLHGLTTTTAGQALTIRTVPRA